MDKKRIYFAGGWFNPAQEEEHTRVGNFLNVLDFAETFNPRTSGGDFKPGKETDAMTLAFLSNCQHIDEADIIVAITDYKDMGTLWETGYAYKAKKPIIYYAETLGDKPFNLMLAKTGKVAKTIVELFTLLCDELSYKFVEVQNYEGDIE